MIKDSVRHQILRIAYLEQAKAATLEISRRLEADEKTISAGVQSALKLISTEINGKMAEAWSAIALMAPISEEAMELLREKTKSWFSDDLSSISYLFPMTNIQSLVELRKEVASMFGCETIDSIPTEPIVYKGRLIATAHAKPPYELPVIGFWLNDHNTTHTARTVVRRNGAEERGRDIWLRLTGELWLHEYIEPDYWQEFPLPQIERE